MVELLATVTFVFFILACLGWPLWGIFTRIRNGLRNRKQKGDQK